MPDSADGRPQFRLGELLLQAGVVTRAQLSAALENQKRAGGRLGSNLIEMGACDERTIAHVLAEQLKIPSVTAAQLDKAAKGALALIKRELAERHRAIPIRIDGQRLWVATADPTDRDAIGALERASGYEVRPMVAPDVLIDFALDKHYGIARRARVVAVRDAGLLEASPGPALYEPHLNPPPASALGFLDDLKTPPPVPSAAQAVRGVDGDALRARLLSAPSDDDIFARLLDALQPVAGRLAIFLVRGGFLVAHRGRGLEQRSLEVIRLPLNESPAMLKLLEATAPYIGPLPSQLGSLFQEMGTPSGLALPITLGKQPIGILIGGMVDPGILEQVAVLQRVVTLVDLALHARHVRARLARS